MPLSEDPEPPPDVGVSAERTVRFSLLDMAGAPEGLVIAAAAAI